MDHYDDIREADRAEWYEAEERARKQARELRQLSAAMFTVDELHTLRPPTLGDYGAARREALDHLYRKITERRSTHHIRKVTPWP